MRRGTDVFNARISTRADKHLVDLNINDGRVGLEVHVRQRAFHPLALHLVRFLRRVGHFATHAGHHLRVSAPGDLRLYLSGIQLHHGIKMRAFVTVQRAPVFRGLVPLRARGRKHTALAIGNCFLVTCHHARTCAGLNGEIAQSHTPFHRQIAYRTTGELNRMAGAASGADLADDRKRDVLGCNAHTQLAIDHNIHILVFLHHHALRGEHMLDLAGADAERQCPECAVRAGVRIAAHHRHAGQGRTILRPDHMHDALTFVEERKVNLGAVFLDVLVECFDLQARYLILDTVEALIPVARWRVVIRRRHHAVHTPHRAVGELEAFIGLRAGYLMHQVTVDIKQRGAVLLDMHQVAVPKFVV